MKLSYMDNGPLIPSDLVSGGTSSDARAAKAIARRLLPAVRRLEKHATQESGVSVRRISTAADVSSFRIDVADCPYYATITEHNVIETYAVEHRCVKPGEPRMEMRPVLVEVMHVFTVHDAEGTLVSATDAVPPSDKTLPDPETYSVFGDLFAAADHFSAGHAA